jgi:hypothetical protein
MARLPFAPSGEAGLEIYARILWLIAVVGLLWLALGEHIGIWLASTFGGILALSVGALILILPFIVLINYWQRRKGKPAITRLSVYSMALALVLTLCCVPLSIIAVMRLPWFRRWRSSFYTTQLPRIRRRSGVTLIELLIDISILSIFAVAFVHVSQVTHRAAERHERWTEATALAEDAIAWLRAQPALPAAGTHPPAEPVAELHPALADLTSIEIAAGPRPDLRRVTVTVAFHDDLDRRQVRLATLLPADDGAPEAEP